MSLQVSKPLPHSNLTPRVGRNRESCLQQAILEQGTEKHLSRDKFWTGDATQWLRSDSVPREDLNSSNLSPLLTCAFYCTPVRTRGGVPIPKDRIPPRRRTISPFLAVFAIVTPTAYFLAQKMCPARNCAPATLQASHSPKSLAAAREPGEAYFSNQGWRQVRVAKFGARADLGPMR